jgi:DNA-binding CsgD family transcriptional regulator
LPWRGARRSESARALGDRALEFLAADGTAGAYRELGQLDEAKRWLDRAAAVAAASPTPTRSRQLEVSRGLLAGAAGDVEGMRRHFGQAVDMTARTDRRAARCEILALLALECARLAAISGDEELYDEAERRANEAKRLAVDLPGRPPWSMQADSALSSVAASRGDRGLALRLARAVVTERAEAEREEPYLASLLPIAAVLLESGDEVEASAVREELQLLQSLIGQRTLDSEVRARWFRAPIGKELSRLAGPFELDAAMRAAASPEPQALDADAQRLLGLLIEGRTNAEIARELGTTPESVATQLAGMYARIGASSRAEATVMALSGAV